MSKRPGRHRARSFARAVDASGAPPSSVARLVSLANALRNVPQRNPSPGSSLRQQLMVEAATVHPMERRSFWAEWLDRIRFQRGLASTTVLCTVLIAVAGIGFGTTESLPGDTLYSMKLRSESVQLAFVGSDEERGRRNLKFADSRLDEITRLVRHKGDWPATHSAQASEKPDKDAVESLINRTFDTMDSSTGAGAKAMRKAFERSGDTSPLTYLDEFTRRQQSQLRDIIPKLPTGSQAAASDSLAYVGELSKETAKMLGTDCDADATCGDDGSTSAASNPTTPPGEPGSTSPSTDPTSPSASGQTGTDTSAVPPPNSSSSEPPTDTGSSTSEDPSDTDSSTDTGSSTGTPSTSGGSSSTSTPPPAESTSGSESPSATPPEPTGVPSDPDNSSSTKSGDGAQSEDSATSGEGSRETSPPTAEESGAADDETGSSEPTGR